MGLLARIEEVLAPGGQGDVMGQLARPERAHLTRLARAYAAALRYAGCEVGDEEVYLSLARDVMQGGKEGYAALFTLAQGLLLMFFPDWARDEQLAKDDAGKALGAAEAGAAPSRAE